MGTQDRPHTFCGGDTALPFGSDPDSCYDGSHDTAIAFRLAKNGTDNEGSTFTIRAL